MSCLPAPVTRTSRTTALFLAQYGFHVDRVDVVPFLALFNLLDPCLRRIATRSVYIDAGDAGKPDARAQAQRHLVRFQKHTATIRPAAMKASLDGLGLEWSDVAPRFLDRAAVDSEMTRLLRDPAALIDDLLSELIVDAAATPFLLRIGSIRAAQRQARQAGFVPDPGSRAADEDWLASFRPAGQRRSVRAELHRCGIADAQADDLVDGVATARAWVRQATATRAAQPRPRLESVLSSQVKAPGIKDRSLPLHKTLEKALAVRQKVGITRVADITTLDPLGFPVFTAVRPEARVDISVSSGKGTTRDASLVSCLMEAIEGFTAENPRQSRRTIRTLSYAEARGSHDLIDPQRLLPSRFPNEPYDAARPIEWIDGVDLASGRTVWVPLELVAMGDCALLLHHFQVSSGLAAGNNVEEAILHGLCEAIERDATKCFYMSLVEANVAPQRLGLARISLQSLPAPLAAIVARIEQQGMQVRLLDITNDLGISTVCAVLIDEDPLGDATSCGHPADGKALALGFGTHLDPELAASRALTEAIQAHAIRIQGAREDLVHSTDVSLRLVNRQQDTTCVWLLPVDRFLPLFEATADLIFAPDAPEIRLDRMPTIAFEDIRDDIAEILQCLARCGLDEVIAVDLTHPELDIPVVRMVVPGLEVLDLHRVGWRGLRYLLGLGVPS